MSLTIEIPREYGYVILTATSTYFLTLWHTFRVGGYRRRARVPYPIPYAYPTTSGDDPSLPEERKEHKGLTEAEYLFNCAQRGHAHMLENYPIVLSSLLISGFEYPLTASALGLGWIAGRWIYAVGYTNKAWGPNGRGRLKGGAPHWLFMLGLLTLTGWTGLKMVLPAGLKGL
ncbi:MAG: hypothetical protein M1824_002108 [Vezdaea acicularis]|nr:MAG: hypothetical protein M1824_002108 [Vezdaea acicularis]